MTEVDNAKLRLAFEPARVGFFPKETARICTEDSSAGISKVSKFGLKLANVPVNKSRKKDLMSFRKLKQ
jgi:hypothetical protein